MDERRHLLYTLEPAGLSLWDAVLQERVDTIDILDATAEHGWTKGSYMPLGCRSPEDFRNIALTGNWHSQTL